MNGGQTVPMGRLPQPLRIAPAWSEGISNETSDQNKHQRQCRGLPLGDCGDHEGVDVTGGQEFAFGQTSASLLYDPSGPSA
jgi:hypothetical protein